MDTSQFGQDTGGDDIYFDEAGSDDESEGEAGAAAANEPANGNLNRRTNVTSNYLEDMTDSDETETEEDE